MNGCGTPGRSMAHRWEEDAADMEAAKAAGWTPPAPVYDHPRQQCQTEIDIDVVSANNREFWTPERIEAQAVNMVRMAKKIQARKVLNDAAAVLDSVADAMVDMEDALLLNKRPAFFKGRSLRWFRRRLAGVAAVGAFSLSGCTYDGSQPPSMLSLCALIAAAAAVVFAEVSGRRANSGQKVGLLGPEVMDWPTPDQAAELETRLSGPAASCMVIGGAVSREADGSSRPVSCGYGDAREPIGHVQNVRQIDGRIFADIVPTQGFVDQLRGVVLAREGVFPEPPRLGHGDLLGRVPAEAGRCSMKLREASRKEWSARSPSPTEGEINLGSLQRIADAVESMRHDVHEILLVARRADRRAAKRAAQ